MGTQNKNAADTSIINGDVIWLIIIILLENVPIFFKLYGDDYLAASLFIYIIVVALFAVFLATRQRSFPIPKISGEPVWRTVSPEKFFDFLDKQKPAEGSTAFKVASFFLDNTFFRVIGVGIALIIACAEYYVMASIIINVMYIPALILRAYRGAKSPYESLEAFKSFIKGLREGFDSINLPISIQLCLGQADGKPAIQDKVRIQIDYPNKPSDWLCSMISFTRTDVRSVKYPYIYYVLVIKGKDAAANVNFCDHIRHAISNIDRKSKLWSLEVKIQDDNSVFVITKRSTASTPYSTDLSEVMTLPEIAKKIFEGAYLLDMPGSKGRLYNNNGIIENDDEDDTYDDDDDYEDEDIDDEEEDDIDDDADDEEDDEEFEQRKTKVNLKK